LPAYGCFEVEVLAAGADKGASNICIPDILVPERAAAMAHNGSLFAIVGWGLTEL